jgi:hypothetical protein
MNTISSLQDLTKDAVPKYMNIPEKNIESIIKYNEPHKLLVFNETELFYLDKDKIVKKIKLDNCYKILFTNLLNIYYDYPSYEYYGLCDSLYDNYWREKLNEFCYGYNTISCDPKYFNVIYEFCLFCMDCNYTVEQYHETAFEYLLIKCLIKFDLPFFVYDFFKYINDKVKFDDEDENEYLSHDIFMNSINEYVQNLIIEMKNELIGIR